MLEGRSSPGELHCRIMSSHDTRKWESKSHEEGSEAPTEKNEAEKGKCLLSDPFFFFPKQIWKKKNKKFISRGKQGLRSGGCWSSGYTGVAMTQKEMGHPPLIHPGYSWNSRKS